MSQMSRAAGGIFQVFFARVEAVLDGRREG